MNIWILKYSTSGFSSHFVNETKKITTTIEQLKFSEIYQKQLGNFHYISLSTKFENSQKKYIEDSDVIVRGYSGLLIGKNDAHVDYRTIENLNCNQPELYNGQFCLFTLNSNSFVCKTDNFGFHKVFFFKKGNDIYVSNYLKLLELTEELQPDTEQMVTDFLTSRFGVFPGYNTLFEGVKTLPEYGQLQIENGVLEISNYKSLNELLNPKPTFEENLRKTKVEFKNAGQYLRNFHKTAIGLSGGFDGRLMLSFFYNTQGKSLETFTYNRAGKLDLWIAAYLSKQFKVSHKTFKLKTKTVDFVPKLNKFKDSKGDAFTKVLNDSIADFFQTQDCFKVSLGGNGADTDWEFGEKQLNKLNVNEFKSFIKSYSLMLVSHPLVSIETTTTLALKLENYFLNKYAVFETKENYLQLLGSAFFHLERFRGEQGFGYSQNQNTNKDIFTPFATESFNQTVFSATKNQLQRTLKEGIHFRIYHSMTEGKVPYAPILTARNQFGKNSFQKTLNFIAPYLPKIIWKLNNGDTNTQLRNKFASEISSLSKDYILEQEKSELWHLLNYSKIKIDITHSEYKGQYNTIATMVKFLEINKK
jgi:hypothetical protein